MTDDRRDSSDILTRLGITMTPGQIAQATLAEERELAAKKLAADASLPPTRRIPAMRASLQQLNEKLAAARHRQSIGSPSRAFPANAPYVNAIRAALSGAGGGAWERAMDELVQACLCEENPLAAATYKLVAIDSMSSLSGIPPAAAARLARGLSSERLLASNPSQWKLPDSGDPDLMRKAAAAWRKIEELEALAGAAEGKGRQEG